MGTDFHRYYKNNSHRFTDFQKSFLICESVAKKKNQAELRGIKTLLLQKI